MEKSGYTIGLFSADKLAGVGKVKDFFVVSAAKKRTEKDAAKIATAAGIEPSLVNITFIKKTMQAGAVTTYFSEKWKKTVVKINTDFSGSIGFLEDQDAVIIE